MNLPAKTPLIILHAYLSKKFLPDLPLVVHHIDS